MKVMQRRAMVAVALTFGVVSAPALHAQVNRMQAPNADTPRLLVAVFQSSDRASGVQAAEAIKKSQQDMQGLVEASQSLQQEAESSGFQLLPSQWTWGWKHLAGMAIFAGLLSMGAPYWFNLLKTLTGFRPALAQQVDKENARKTAGQS